MSNMNKWIRLAAVVAALTMMLTAVSCESQPQTESSSKQTSSSELVSEPSEESEIDPVPSFVESEIDNIHNLALHALAFADSVSSDYPNYTADRINDGDELSRWASEKAGTEEEPSLFGLEWEEARTFDVVLIFWNANHPSEGGFTVTVDEPLLEEVETAENGETSTDGSEMSSGEEKTLYRVYRRDTEEDDGQMDVILFSRPVTSKTLTICCTEPYYSETYRVDKDQPSCYELEVYYSVDVEGELSALDTAVEDSLSHDVTTETD